MARLRASVREGLDRVEKLGVGRGYLEGMGGWTSAAGFMARLEAGYRPTTNLNAFAFGQWDQKYGTSAGVGMRLTW